MATARNSYAIVKEENDVQSSPDTTSFVFLGLSFHILFLVEYVETNRNVVGWVLHGHILKFANMTMIMISRSFFILLMTLLFVIQFIHDILSIRLQHHHSNASGFFIDAAVSIQD